MIVRDGTNLLRTTADQIRVHSTGLPTIDQLLGGGLRDEQLIEIAGPCCTGKTQICFGLAASLVLKGHPVHWIDMTGGFSAARLHQILKGKLKEKNIHPLELMRQVQVSRVANALKLFHLLHGIKAANARPAVYIIDGIGPSLQALRAGSTHHLQGPALISEIGNMMKWIARRHGCAVITTNHVDGSNRPMGGISWIRGPQYRLLMQTAEAKGDESMYMGSLQSTTFLRPNLNSWNAKLFISSSGPCLAGDMES